MASNRAQNLPLANLVLRAAGACIRMPLMPRHLTVIAPLARGGVRPNALVGNAIKTVPLVSLARPPPKPARACRDLVLRAMRAPAKRQRKQQLLTFRPSAIPLQVLVVFLRVELCVENRVFCFCRISRDTAIAHGTGTVFTSVCECVRVCASVRSLKAQHVASNVDLGAV